MQKQLTDSRSRYDRWRSPEGAGTTRDRRGMSGVTSDQPVWAVDMGIGTFFTRDWTARDERDPPARALRSSCGVEVTRPTVIGRSALEVPGGREHHTRTTGRVRGLFGLTVFGGRRGPCSTFTWPTRDERPASALFVVVVWGGG